MTAAIIAGLPETITLAELRVLEFAATSALCDKEIAQRLNVSVSCVKHHLHNIYAKMGWRGPQSRVKLLKWCLARGNNGEQ